jgi:hypothetical protein
VPFVPRGKKARQAHVNVRQGAPVCTERERDEVLDRAVGAVRSVVRGRGLCLASAVLLDRILERVLPADGFKLKLGSLQVSPVEPGTAGVAYDPRGPAGVDGGFHAWVEDKRGELVDPSITATLAAEGYLVDSESLIQCAGRTFNAFGLRFFYEELQELELINVEEAEPYLSAALHLALTGEPPSPARVLSCPLDVRWRRP